jgi:UDP-N-acetylmuramoyl-L-alanyl-D-glutamate--2,6-diaminopimelate ligase
MFNSSTNFVENLLATFAIDCQLELTTCVRHLVNDSRKVKVHDIFCAVQGTVKNGSIYIQQAIDNGCDLILAECQTKTEHGRLINVKGKTNTCLQLSFYQLNANLFELSQGFYCRPNTALTMIGITGTNGKTTTSQLIAELLNACQSPCAVIGTNGAGNISNLIPLDNTTPAATYVHQLLHDFTTENYDAVAMEVSSHALAQHRVKSKLFDIAIFTNLSRDHLDYHQTMAKYGQAKYQLFSHNEQQIAILNGDDKQAQEWLAHWPKKQKVLVYGKSTTINQYQQFVQASAINYHTNGVSFTLVTDNGQVIINSPLLGEFNIDNLLAAIAVLIVQGINLNKIANIISFLSPIAGRMERFSADKLATAIVDYAHTPDALKNALLACRHHCQGNLWVVFGCGGDRDKGKRAQMGRIAEKYSDHVIITDDNPRSESPIAISNDILSGCQHPEKVTVLLTRQQAVINTLSNALADDLVLLAGKGHEDYIIDGIDRIPYNEREVVRSHYASFKNEITI